MSKYYLLLITLFIFINNAFTSFEVDQEIFKNYSSVSVSSENLIKYNETEIMNVDELTQKNLKEGNNKYTLRYKLNVKKIIYNSLVVLSVSTTIIGTLIGGTLLFNQFFNFNFVEKEHNNNFIGDEYTIWQILNL